MRRLVAVLACRNNGKRLFGKPLQNLDVKTGETVLCSLIKRIQLYPVVEDIVLAISDSPENEVFKKYVKSHNLKCILGDDTDVLGRLITGCEKATGTDVLRITTECPFPHLQDLDKAWHDHVRGFNDLTALDGVPDGTGYEIITLDALKKSWVLGDERHRSELCSLYIRENPTEFKISQVEIPKQFLRSDLRITVDNPEDLILCRFLYLALSKNEMSGTLSELISILDSEPHIKQLVSKYL